MVMKRYLWIIWALFCFAGCESLEDTYSDYSGDGPRRYLGACTNVTVTSGWEKLHVSWDNAVDPVVTNVKITWISDGVSHDTLIPTTKTSCVIPRLEDKNYEIRIVTVDGKGNSSFEELKYARPYTMTHEEVIAFPRVVAKYFFAGAKGDRLVLFFNSWDESVQEATLTYTKADKTPGSLNLKTLIVDESKKYYTIPDVIDPEKEVQLIRKGHVADCEELITLDPLKFTGERSFTSDIKLLLETKYKQGSHISDAFVEGLEELEIDYSISSFEDILYFPNLKKLHLGKNRFLHAGSMVSTNAVSEVFEKEKSLFSLQQALEILDGLEIIRYNEHYIDDWEASQNHIAITQGEAPVPPVRAFYSPTNWSVKSSVDDDNESDLKLMIDENENSYWQAFNGDAARLHELTIDMEEVKDMHGMRFHQKFISEIWDQSLINQFPDAMTVEVSEDGIVWSKAPDTGSYTLGRSEGEVTDVVFSSPVRARYVKLVYSDYPLFGSYSLYIAEVRVF